ncbi:hypothetical protein Scep_006811 [Stephania cephalantha]|uniref:Uncharacterized protein n=1 Tax=Stephania cephalantha TaxID=152367 RepID=A0AAP0KAL5_9MAGN
MLMWIHSWKDQDAANARGLSVTSISESDDDFATQANQPRYDTNDKTEPGDDDVSGSDDDNAGVAKTIVMVATMFTTIVMVEVEQYIIKDKTTLQAKDK